MSKQVYLAGPCFSAAERRWNVQVTAALEAVCPGKFKFYLPQANVEENWPSPKIQRTLVEGLIASSVVVANLDGPGGDDGTCWEMGFTAGMNSVLMMIGHNPLRKIFWYRTDFRNGGDSDLNVNLMMAYGGTQILIDDISPNEVAKSISRALIA